MNIITENIRLGFLRNNIIYDYRLSYIHLNLIITENIRLRFPMNSPCPYSSQTCSTTYLLRIPIHIHIRCIDYSYMRQF